MSDEIKFHPANTKNTYKHWIDNIKDWCISRQLWWGQQIPAWYAPNGEFAVAKTAAEAIEKFKSKDSNFAFSVSDLKQDEDVLDTWFSSWLWPISVFDGFKEEGQKDIKYYYPTNDLVTAPEIMFFWVARMIMAGYEWIGEKPFSNVYYTGIVRDKQRRKMSKSLGNSPDPLDLIAHYGADGVRMGMLLCSPAGNDILFDESQVEQGRNFANKIWNAYRLVKGWEVKPDSEFDAELLASNKVSENWFNARFNEVLQDIESKFTDYKLSEGLMGVYKLIWDDFCSWYLEMIKPEFGKPINESSYKQSILFFENLMKVLHPFMPFITEEIWQNIAERKSGDSICIAAYPSVGAYQHTPIQNAFETISKIRELRNSKGISPKEAFEIIIKTDNEDLYKPYQFSIKKLANISSIQFNTVETYNYTSLPVATDQVFVKLNIQIDVEAEKEKINSEISYLEGFLKSVEAKLSNEKFVANAKPELVEKERQKQADALAKIDVLKGSLASL
jgi:valyl-tRNA synthetase